MTVLNVGCGDDVRPGAVNVDLRPVGQVVADAACLPFRDRAGDVLAFDILEHFPHDRIGAVLDEWHRVCDDTLTVRVPNMDRLAHALIGRSHTPDALIRNIYGGHRWGHDGAWDAHHWGWTPDTIERDLTVHGFTVAANDRGLNMTVEATR